MTIGTSKSCFAELYSADSFAVQGVRQFPGAEHGNEIIADGQDEPASRGIRTATGAQECFL